MFNGIRTTTKKIYIAEDKKTAQVVEVVCGRRSEGKLNIKRWGYSTIEELIKEHYADYDVYYDVA